MWKYFVQEPDSSWNSPVVWLFGERHRILAMIATGWTKVPGVATDSNFKFLCYVLSQIDYSSVGGHFREAEVTFIDLDTSLFHQKKYKEHFGNVTNQMAWLLYGCTFKNTPVTMPQGSCWLCWRRSTVVGMAAFGGCSLVARRNFRWFSCWHRRRYWCYHLNFGTSQFNH